MLFNLSYTEQGSQSQISVLVSGSNISSVIVYCDSNNFTPKSILQTNANLIINNLSTESYQVSLDEENVPNSNQTIFYGTFDNLINWISSQVGFNVRSINRQDRNLVIA